MLRVALVLLLASIVLAPAAQGQAIYHRDPGPLDVGERYSHRRHGDRAALENQIGRLQSENAALRRELAGRKPEDRAALESLVAQLQSENGALKKELAARKPEDR